jgi:hypothetical protein
MDIKASLTLKQKTEKYKLFTIWPLFEIEAIDYYVGNMKHFVLLHSKVSDVPGNCAQNVFFMLRNFKPSKRLLIISMTASFQNSV